MKRQMSWSRPLGLLLATTASAQTLLALRLETRCCHRASEDCGSWPLRALAAFCTG